MLRLKNISKTYKAGSTKVQALKGISVSFRKNEFVSILGPSGCGKTTTLNIIGGLDQYTSGDLFINGVSTKKYKSRDWDVYRNHRVGFIFQSYNLIPHQTILGNVELALTIAGLSKKERVQKAKDALDRVGLKNEYKKKPNQLSGGQCQRVAIARALVNEPEILLADEPTGALDSVTSVQIMKLISEIAKDKLVIMVTHNADLAKKYSTRIIRLLDGEIESDSNPFSEEDEIKESNLIKRMEGFRKYTLKKQHKKDAKEKAKMSFFTAAKLSAQNLNSKKGRTWMVAIAGSIGIIGVSLVLAISGGIHNYINNMQDDLLSGNPITIEESGYDISSLTEGAANNNIQNAIDVKDGYLNVNSIMAYLIEMNENKESMMISNDITEEYLQFIRDMPEEYYSAITLAYGINPTNNIYTDFDVSSGSDATSTRSLSSIIENYTAVLGESEYKDLSSYISMFSESVSQLPANNEYILEQYDLVAGDIAEDKDEIMVVLSNKTELTDISLAELGYYTQDEFLNTTYKAADSDLYDPNLDKEQFAYDEIMNKEFYYYSNDEVYEANTGTPTAQMNPFYYNYKTGEMNDASSGMKLKVSGILRPKDNISYGCLETGFYYTQNFTKYYLEDNFESEIVKYLNDSEQESFSSMSYQGMDIGITYKLDYELNGTDYNKTAFVGSSSGMSSILAMIGMGGSSGDDIKTLSLRHLGGNKLANSISIYPINFDEKYEVTDYLDLWNDDNKSITLSSGTILEADKRNDITYSDPIGIIITLINTMINIVSYALIAFTALSLLVSTVMIGIITYVSVIERVKEIGVIRSLGGRKRDVSNLFVAETIMLGLASGIIGIGFTYLASFIVNIIMVNLIGFELCALPWYEAVIMIVLSVVLTLISGIIPANHAAKQDPVVALRTE